MAQGSTRDDIGVQTSYAPAKATPASGDKFGYWDITGLRWVYATWTQLRTALSLILADIAMPKVSTPTIDDARKDFTTRGSVGVTDGTVAYITAYPTGGASHINISPPNSYLRSTNDPQGDLYICRTIGYLDYGLANPPTGQVTTAFIGVFYNSGSPAITIHSSYDWNFNNNFPLGTVTWDGTTLRIINDPWRADDTPSLSQKSLGQTLGFVREQTPDVPNGLEIADVATREISMSAGAVWHGINRFAVSAIAAGTAFYTHYLRSGGGFVSTSGVTQWPNDKYDDMSGTLATLTAGYYACLWVYYDVAGGTLNVVYGRAAHKNITEAQGETQPATMPSNLLYQGVYLGRIIFQKSETSAALVEIAWKHNQTYVSSPTQWSYGDGYDGNATLDGTNLYPWLILIAANTYQMIRDAYLTNLTINAGVTLKYTYRLFVTGTFTLSGTLDCKGGNASGATAGAVAPSGWYPVGMAAGAGIASGGAAADGTAANTSGRLIGGLGGRGAAAWASAILRRGKNGYSTNAFNPAVTGGWLAAHNILGMLSNYYPNSTNTLIQISPAQGGGGGAKSGTGTSLNSGGGGGGGGIILCAARNIVITATGSISANGGTGGNAAGTGANAGGGGGGGGGLIGLLYDTLSNMGSISAAGGLGGTSIALGSTPLRAVGALVVTTNSLITSQSGVASSALRLAGVSSFGGASNTLYILQTWQVGGTLNDPSVAGWGLTWTKINSVDYNTIATPTERMVLYWAYGTPNLNGDLWGTNAIDVIATFSSAPTSGARAALYEIQNSTNIIVQSATNRSNSASTLSVTLSAVGSTDSAILGFFSKNSAAAYTAGTGFSIINDNGGTTMAELSYNDTSVDTSWTGAAPVGGVAVEIQAIGTMENGTPGLDGQILYMQNKV